LCQRYVNFDKLIKKKKSGKDNPAVRNWRKNMKNDFDSIKNIKINDPVSLPIAETQKDESKIDKYNNYDYASIFWSRPCLSEFVVS
jgi:hypothetical protein